MRRHKKARGHEEVSLNLAAMLDMAFQLLAFFILTFRANPVEGQINLNLPPPVPVAPQNELKPDEREFGLGEVSAKTLTITIVAAGNGQVASVSVGLGKVVRRPTHRPSTATARSPPERSLRHRGRVRPGAAARGQDTRLRRAHANHRRLHPAKDGRGQTGQ